MRKAGLTWWDMFVIRLFHDHLANGLRQREFAPIIIAQTYTAFERLRGLHYCFLWHWKLDYITMNCKYYSTALENNGWILDLRLAPWEGDGILQKSWRSCRYSSWTNWNLLTHPNNHKIKTGPAQCKVLCDLCPKDERQRVNVSNTEPLGANDMFLFNLTGIITMMGHQARYLIIISDLVWDVDTSASWLFGDVSWREDQSF